MGMAEFKNKLNRPDVKKESKKPSGTREADMKSTPSVHADWSGKTKGSTTHTYKA